MDEMDKSVHCKVSLSERTVDILCKMAEEDHVSLTTEIENAISGWYRFRHGYTDLATLNPCIIVHEDGRGEIKFIKEGTKNVGKLGL